MKVQMQTPGTTIWRNLPGATVKDAGDGRWELTARCPTPLQASELEASSFRIAGRMSKDVALKKGQPRKPVAAGAVFVLHLALSEAAPTE